MQLDCAAGCLHGNMRHHTSLIVQPARVYRAAEGTAQQYHSTTAVSGSPAPLIRMQLDSVLALLPGNMHHYETADGIIDCSMQHEAVSSSASVCSTVSYKPHPHQWSATSYMLLHVGAAH